MAEVSPFDLKSAELVHDQVSFRHRSMVPKANRTDHQKRCGWLATAIWCNEPDVQAAMPEPALAINILMSAALAVFWADRLNQPQIVLPYQATGYVERGKTLLDIFKRIPTDASQDTALIDAWADTLGIRSWYRWEKATGA